MNGRSFAGRDSRGLGAGNLRYAIIFAVFLMPTYAQNKDARLVFDWVDICGTTDWFATCEFGTCSPPDATEWINNWGMIACATTPDFPTSGSSVFIRNPQDGPRATINVHLPSNATMQDFNIFWDGQLTVAGGATMTVEVGPFTNDGLVILNSDASGTTTLEFLSTSPMSLTGSGILELNGVSGANARITGTTTGLITHTFPHLICGAGEIEAQLTNASTILADIPGESLDLTPIGVSGMLNTGIMEVAPGCQMGIHSVTSFAQGPVGRIIVDGTLTIHDGALTIDSGTLEGTGTIVGAVANAVGVVLPGGSYPGALSITGTYAQASTAMTTIKLAGTAAATEYDQLHVSAGATLAGDLFPVPINGFIPQPGQVFTVLTGSPVIGTFSSVITSGTYDVTYDGSSVTLTCTTSPNTPDIDLDGTVTLLDMCRVIMAYGPVTQRSTPENMNGDDRVDIQDLVMVGGNWPANPE